jgi:DNA-binding response OmpR family regulator
MRARITPLLPCGQVGKHMMKCNDRSRVVGVDEEIIHCTVLEYKIMKLLLPLEAVTDLALIHELFGSPDSSAQNSLKKHIEHLREKLKGTGIGISRVQGYGYLLVEVQ